MAKAPVSQEEIQLRKRARRRLVGAVALVLVAIVVLPMVLDGEPRQQPENISIQIPPIPPEAPAQGAAPAPPPAPSEAPGAAASVPEAAPAAPEPAAAIPAPAPAPPPLAPAEPRADAEPRAAAAPAQSVVIQIGCFSDARKSRALAGQIKASKIPAFSEPAPGAGRTCIRVRAGPFPSQEAAQRAREQLLKLKLIPAPSEGKIVRRGD